MYSIYRMKSNELDNKFLESLRTLFRGKEIEIAVSEVPDELNYEAQAEGERRTILEALDTVESNTGRFI